MAWSFNPFTGNLDLTGSSGAVVFEGEVETFADLPEVVGDPPVGSSYLVRTSTGVWLVNKRQSGIWIRRNNTGVRATDWEYGGDYPVNSVAGKTGNVTLTNSDISGLGSAATANLNAISDSDLRIVGSTDATKKVAIEVDTNVPSGQTVILTAPSSGGTIARTSDIPSTFAASAITSGVLDNARINFAAPPAIGAQSPNTALFSNLWATSRLNLPSASGNSANDIWVSSGKVRYQAGSLVTSARTLLSAEDNLSNLADTATARTNLGVGSSDAVTFGSIQGTPIGSTTAAAITGTTGTFTTLNATNGTITASAPVLDLSQTWNASGTTFTALRLNATNTASASGSLLMDLQTGGTSQFSVRRDGRVNCNSITVGGVSTMDTGAGQLLIRNAVLGWDNNAVMIQNTDLQLFRDAADTLAQRRTTNPQTFRIYNTVSGTNNVNFERANFRWASNEFIIDAEAGGTGTALRGIKIGSATSSLLGFYGATPVTQRAAIADATDAATTQARLNDLLAAMRSLGLIAT